MSCVIQWLNSNSGALMVVITTLYVIATISISRSNKKSAEASRELIIESQKQQTQNAGLQLYGLRKEAISKVAHENYNEVFWDIPLLFSEDLFLEFQKVAFKAGRIEELYKSIERFEAELQILVGPEASLHAVESRVRYLSNKDLNQFKQSIVQFLQNKRIRSVSNNSVEEYAAQVQEVNELKQQYGIDAVQLRLHLNSFVKKSIEG